MSNLPLLPPAPIVDANGVPTISMQQFWQQFEQAITANIAQAIDALTQATAALNAATAAQSTADGKLDIATANTLYVGQDVTPTWTVPTGTVARGAYSTYSAPTISNPPTQSQVQGIADAVQAVSRLAGALVTDLKANNTLT